MKRVLVTGSNGFVGKNLCAVLRLHKDIELYEYGLNRRQTELDVALQQVDYIIHLAGVNRPKDPKEFGIGNVKPLKEICLKLQELGRAPKVILSSSIQAELDNLYGISKHTAEVILYQFAKYTGAECVVYRFKNLFGKWCRPNYNSVVATLCYNIAHGFGIQISNPQNEVELTHIDIVVEALITELEPENSGFRFAEPLPSRKITLEELVQKIESFHKIRTSLCLPDLRDTFDRVLYSTYLSYLNSGEFEYGLEVKSDQRGSLAEFLKSPSMGQIFVSHTGPGITRGNHYHHTKVEKFLVLHGNALIRLRHINSNYIVEYRVKGEDYQVLDIPPGYTHSIENVGQDDLVTLFWASEMFDPERPDTYYEGV